jgi:thermolysin
VGGQTQNEIASARRFTGRIIESYRENPKNESLQPQQTLQDQNRGRPAWAEQALERSLTFLEQQRGKIRQLPENLNRETSDLRQMFKLDKIDRDDLGQTHVRLAQFHSDVPVFGGRLLTNSDGQIIRNVNGRVFDMEGVETIPNIGPEQSIEIAKEALRYAGDFAGQPTAKLVVLPNEFFQEADRSGAALVYQVELIISGDAKAPARHQYFVDAKKGNVIWHYDNLPNHIRQSTGHSLYSGTVSMDVERKEVSSSSAPFGGTTTLQDSLIDSARGGTQARNLWGVVSKNLTWMVSDQWGDGTKNNWETAYVDAYWGAQTTWDYFLNRHSLRGVDGFNGVIVNRLTGLDNAFQLGYTLNFGEGDLQAKRPTNPWVSLDVVGHEYTHLITELSAGLIYNRESGALNESFSDIFGTAVEFYVRGNNGNYTLAEEVTTSGRGIRSMSNPQAFGDPNHYSNRLFPGFCAPNNNPDSPGRNDNCGVHSNSGIQNNAFFLLAEGGTNATSGISVAGIGRQKAEKIFYRALTVYLFESAQFIDAREAAIAAAIDLFGRNSQERLSTEAAWDAVGVGDMNAICARHFSISPDSHNFGDNGGTFSVSVRTGGGECSWSATSSAPRWLSITSGSGDTGNGMVSYHVSPNMTASRREARIDIQGQFHTVTQASKCLASSGPLLRPGNRVSGSLTTGDCLSSHKVYPNGDRPYADHYRFNGQAGQRVAIWVDADFSAQLSLIGPRGSVLDNRTTPATGSRIPATGFITLPEEGVYGIEVTSALIRQTGRYELVLSPGCSLKDIAIGDTVRDSLGSSDCFSGEGPGNNTRMRQYKFYGVIDQRIAISMNASGFASRINLRSLNGILLASADSGRSGVSSQLPSQGYFTLRDNGVYIIEATSVVENELGIYTLTLSDSCGTSVIRPEQSVNAELGVGDCRQPGETKPRDKYSFYGVAGQRIAVALTTTEFDSYLALMGPNYATTITDYDSRDGLNSRIPESGYHTLPANGVYTIVVSALERNGSYTLRLSGDCSSAALNTTAFNLKDTTIQGELTAGDCFSTRTRNTHTDRYKFTVTTGQRVAIAITQSEFNSMMYLIGPDGQILDVDHNSGPGGSPRIPSSGYRTLSSRGTYTIEVTSDNEFATGSYTLQLDYGGFLPPPSIGRVEGSSAGRLSEIGFTVGDLSPVASRRRESMVGRRNCYYQACRTFKPLV